MNDFFIGWLPSIPAALAPHIRRVVLLLAAIAVLTAMVLAAAQRPFAASFFEFHQYRDFEGTAELNPYPALLVERPGGGISRYLLVDHGKHGADAALRAFAGQRVRLRGELIYRGSTTMVQLWPGSVAPLGPGRAAETVDEGEQTLAGEIVDSKCYLGVMNPGSGKVHRDCAARCISGGLPPAFVARGEGGAPRVYLLTSATGEPANRAVLPYVAEPVRMRGRVLRSGDTYTFAADLASIARLP